MTTSEIATVLAWHDALNASDLDTLVALSSDDIEVGDAHGAAQANPAPPSRLPSAWCTITSPRYFVTTTWQQRSLRPN
jgi:ketosteroid isomerase-like protein